MGTAFASRLLSRFDARLSPALIVLLCLCGLELVIYRFFAHTGVFMAVGATGPLARLADVGMFAMVGQGVLSSVLLFVVMGRLVNSPHLPGLWWRGVLILVSPVYLLCVLWSIWVSLSGWILLACLVGVLITLLTLVPVAAVAPMGGGIRRVVLILLSTLLLAIGAWVILDFFEIPRSARLGEAALFGFRFAEGLALAVPVFAFFILCARPGESFTRWLRHPHVPSLLIAVACTGLFLALAGEIQKAGGGGLLVATQTFIRVAYRTLGFTLAWPLAIPVAALSTFFLSLAVAALLIPTTHHPTTPARQQVGFALAFIYLSGLQPMAVYQLALTLVGVFLLLGAVVEPLEAGLDEGKVTYPDFRDMLAELDKEAPHGDTGPADHREAH